jgi:hypothetical protein
MPPALWETETRTSGLRAAELAAEVDGAPPPRPGLKPFGRTVPHGVTVVAFRVALSSVCARNHRAAIRRMHGRAPRQLSCRAVRRPQECGGGRNCGHVYSLRSSSKWVHLR